MIARFLTLGLTVALLQACASQSQPSIRYISRGTANGDGFFEVSLGDADRLGLPTGPLAFASGKKRFPVTVVPESDDQPAGMPPLAGEYHVAEETLRFKPHFSLSPGVRYRAIFHSASGSRFQSTLRLPKKPPETSTRVTAVYPSAQVLPENLLRLYIHFSQPMTRGQAWEHLRMQRSSTGQFVDLPFLELDEELWDRSGRRLTVLIDPGRVKRELLPSEELGGALIAGEQYTLEISREWQDANGAPLQEGFRKRFKVVAADREPIDPQQWRVRRVASGSREPLIVDLGEPLDHGLLHSQLGIENAAGRGVDGEIAVTDNESRWRFIPTEPWSPGTYRIVILTTLEDVAGNSVGRPFEVDLVEPVSRRVEVSVENIDFRVD